MIGYHVSQEQFLPSKLLKLAIKAEKAGFSGIISSDHFYPWSINQGQSGFAWSWLGAALQATSFSSGIVSSPGYRYHPAIIAQASATLSEMFPERFWLCLGSGELLNEGIIGDAWPIKEERNKILKSSVEVIRRLWKGETVTCDGLITVKEAYLYTRPDKPPLLFGAALSPKTALWLGSFADGLVTVGSLSKLKDIIDAFRRGGGSGKPVYAKVEVSYSSDVKEAEYGAMQQWKFSVLGSSANAMFRLPEMFDEASSFMKIKDVKEQVYISSNPDDHIKYLEKLFHMGIDRLYVHNVNLGQEQFIEFYSKEVLPSFNNR